MAIMQIRSASRLDGKRIARLRLVVKTGDELIISLRKCVPLFEAKMNFTASPTAQYFDSKLP